MVKPQDQFRERVSSLVDQFKAWSEPHDWVTKIYEKRMRDTDREVFELPALLLQKGPVRVLLDPVAYDVPGSEGVVDLYLMPTYDDLASLDFTDGAWRIHYPLSDELVGPENIRDAQVMPLCEEAVNQVLDSIAAHAVPSV